MMGIPAVTRRLKALDRQRLSAAGNICRRHVLVSCVGIAGCLLDLPLTSVCYVLASRAHS